MNGGGCCLGFPEVSLRGAVSRGGGGAKTGEWLRRHVRTVRSRCGGRAAQLGGKKVQGSKGFCMKIGGLASPLQGSVRLLVLEKLFHPPTQDKNIFLIKINSKISRKEMNIVYCNGRGLKMGSLRCCETNHGDKRTYHYISINNFHFHAAKIKICVRERGLGRNEVRRRHSQREVGQAFNN